MFLFKFISFFLFFFKRNSLHQRLPVQVVAYWGLRCWKVMPFIAICRKSIYYLAKQLNSILSRMTLTLKVTLVPLESTLYEYLIALLLTELTENSNHRIKRKNNQIANRMFHLIYEVADILFSQWDTAGQVFENFVALLLNVFQIGTIQNHHKQLLSRRTWNYCCI